MDSGYGDTAGIFSIIFAVFLAFIGFVILGGIAVYVLDGFAFMKLFRKVGVEPWAAWVPIFNRWRLLELGGQAGCISLLGLVSFGSIVAAVFEAIGSYRIGIAFRKDGSWVVLFIFLPFVWAWLLAADKEVYNPDLVRQAGYGPPLAGVGSVAYARAQYYAQYGPNMPPPQSPPTPPA